MEKKTFTRKIAREIASISFGHLTDAMLCYTDSQIDFSGNGESWEQNFEEDMEQMGIVVNARRIRICAEEYDKLKSKLEKLIRKHFYQTT